jgi:protein-S-isoprenylcysteine O-methyltransferase Ste14
MALFGVAELTKNIWFVLAAGLFGLLVTALQILPEERHLEARFGEAYRDYKRRARRWI